MKKNIIIFNTFLLFFLFLFAKEIKASLITVTSEGNVIINVLSSEESIELEVEKSDIEIKEVVENSFEPGSKISLLREEGKAKLSVLAGSKEQVLDISDYKNSVVEIEERPEVEKIIIAVKENLFTIEQRGITAETDLSIDINPDNAGITVETPYGFKFLSILPKEAVDIILRSKYINHIEKENNIQLLEEEKDIAYKIDGEKIINLFNLFEFATPVSAKVSASTGEVLNIEQPTWLKVIGFLFV